MLPNTNTQLSCGALQSKEEMSEWRRHQTIGLASQSARTEQYARYSPTQATTVEDVDPTGLQYVCTQETVYTVKTSMEISF